MSHERILERMKEDIEIIKLALVGDIKEDKPGIMDRVRSLEIEDAKRTWAIRTAIGAALASLASTFNPFK